MSENGKTKKFQNNSLFDYLKNILVSKSYKTYEEHVNNKDEFRSFPSIVVLRYLSMCQDVKVRSIVTDNQILLERLDKIDHRLLYRWLIDNVPKQKTSFITYIKS